MTLKVKLTETHLKGFYLSIGYKIYILQNLSLCSYSQFQLFFTHEKMRAQLL